MAIKTDEILLAKAINDPSLIDSIEKATLAVDTAQKLRMKVPDEVLAAVNAQLNAGAKENRVYTVEQYGQGLRLVVRRKGTLLPSESGDDTP